MNDSDYTARFEETLRRSSQDNLTRLHDELFERYSREDFARICSGESWLDMEGVIVKATSTELGQMGIAGALLIPVFMPMIKALVTLAWTLGWEKGQSEALAKDLGLEDDHAK